jgi:hypothetical protein
VSIIPGINCISYISGNTRRTGTLSHSLSCSRCGIHRFRELGARCRRPTVAQPARRPPFRSARRALHNFRDCVEKDDEYSMVVFLGPFVAMKAFSVNHYFIPNPGAECFNTI